MLMRIYLYILAGTTSALIGWNLGQFLLTDLGLFKQFPEISLFPCIAISLAIGMVLNEIFISNPTRPKICFRIAKTTLLSAAILGLLAGLIAGGISQILLLPYPIPPEVVRTLGWLLIGSSVGLAEGLAWRSRSIEAGDPKRSQERLRTSIMAASGASLVAAGLFELIRTLGEIPEALKSAEDPLGFAILGLLLGLVFSRTNSPSYMAALRAGAGFEYTGEKDEEIEPQPKIDKSLLKFVSDGGTDKIEEGLSIQLPTTGKIRIGSATKKTPHIYLPEVPLHVADIEVKQREALLSPNAKSYHTIEVNGERLDSSRDIPLKHNYVLTFHTRNQGEIGDEKIYRFVYYNRFLDPQA